jgi:hypothetical protein
MTLRPGDKAWIVLGAGVLSYDVLCSDGDTMSEAADAYVLRHPWVTRFVAFSLAAHVCNLAKPELDPIHWLFVLSRKWRRP